VKNSAPSKRKRVIQQGPWLNKVHFLLICNAGSYLSIVLRPTYRVLIGGIMSYTSSSIARIIDHVNRTYFLPAIQRPYVWEADKVVALFDSILKGYPISSFLFWEIRPEHRADWEIYKFVESHRDGEPSNELVEPDGREVVLVLDGQQRLTSLLIGLRGSFSLRAKHARRANPDAWVAHRLYLNLLKDAFATDEDGDVENNGVTYGLKFAPEQPRDSSSALWIKVGRILDCTSDRAYYELQREVIARLPGTATIDQKQTAEMNLAQLYNTVWKNELIAFYTEKIKIMIEFSIYS
jgi:hypothetical protein